MTTEEMLLQLIEGQKRTDEHFLKIDERLDKMDEHFVKIDERLDKMEKDIVDIKDDITEMKEEAAITRFAVNHNGEVLEALTDQLTTLNIADIKY